jgi:PAS domain S-box-containing protein
MDDSPRPLSHGALPAAAFLIDDSQAYPSVEERTAAAHAVLENERSPFRAAFEHAAIGMALVDLDGRFLKVNRSLCQLVGYTSDELQERTFQSITHPDDLQADLELAAKLMRGEIDHYHMEKRYFHKQGHPIWILLSGSLARDPAGGALYAIAQIQDITARKLAEAELARRVRHLERLTAAVSQILQALASSSQDGVCAAVLQSVLDALESEAGLFLRLSDDGDLVGAYIAPQETRSVLCAAADRSSLWNRALQERACLAENNSGHMACGRTFARSLVAPIIHENACLGLFHVGDAPRDYTADDVDFLGRVSAMIAPVIHARIEREKLTPRESEIMDLIVSGMTLKQIAQSLDISVQTVAKHRARVYFKLNVASDVELVHLATESDPVRLAGMLITRPSILGDSN